MRKSSHLHQDETLAFTWNPNLSLKHIQQVCDTAYYTLKNVAIICNLLTPEVAKIIVQKLVISTGLLQWTLAWNIKSSAEQATHCAKQGLQSNKKSKEIWSYYWGHERSSLAENSRAHSIQSSGHNLPMCQWLSSNILNWLTRPQPHEKEFKIRYSRKTSNTMVQSLTSMQQFNQICWTKTVEWTATKYKGGKNFRIIQNTPPNIYSADVTTVNPLYLSVYILIMYKLYLLSTFDTM